MTRNNYFKRILPGFSTFWIMLAAFVCYTGMYAVRKSFLAGQYTGLDLGSEVDPKTLLVVSQVIGYMVSKFLGIKLISELKPALRIYWLVGLVSFGLAMLGVFAIVPGRFKMLALFLNGLPLGMVFGVVLTYLEGRKNTELLIAGLSATFIFSTGFIKTIGVIFIQNFGVSEYWMPLTTGFIFFPFFLFSIWMLRKAKLPDKTDITYRTKRVPMDGQMRLQFLKRYGLGFSFLVLVYVILTIIRDFRDNFVVEFWSELGYGTTPELITITEIPVAVIVLLIAAAGILLKNNRKAFAAAMSLTFLSALGILAVSLGFKSGEIPAVYWMIITGIGVYLPYILYHCVIFERLIAMLKFQGNIVFLFYIADSLGYLASVVVMLTKGFINPNVGWVDFFIDLNIYSSFGFMIFTGIAFYYFNKNYRKKNPTSAS